MPTYTKQKLSASTNGKQIKVAATTSGSAATLIHTAVSGSSSWDEVWLYAVSTGSATVLLTVQWGGYTNPDDFIQVNIPAQSGYLMIVPGNVLQNALEVRAYAATGNVINIGGFVNRIA